MRDSDAEHLICVFSFTFVRGSQPVYSVLVLGVVVLQQHYAKTHKKKFKLFQEKNAWEKLLWQIGAVFILLILAPDRAPHNIQWTMIGSTLSLHWDPVVAMETESKVTGYLVSASL